MKIKVLGMGNTIRCDDAVGIAAVRKLSQIKFRKDVEFEETSEAGLNLFDSIIDYDKLIIIDSIQTKSGQAGDIHKFNQADLKIKTGSKFSHNMGIFLVLKLGQAMKFDLPKEIIFYGVEIEECDVFGEKMSRKVKKTIPKLIDLIQEEINSKRN